MSKELIRLSDCFMKFDDDVILDHINLYINDKEFLTLLGPSGCGKTTTLRIIGGFQKPTSGDVYFDGVRINDVPPHKRKVNTVFQKYALFTHMNIFENVAFGLRVNKVPDPKDPKKMIKVPESEIKERVEEALALVNLAGYGKRSVNSLSGGQQQRVAIARAIVNRPQVLLLDEPLGALDLKLRKDMQIELKRIQQQVGITFIYVTHDQEEALTMSDTIVVMNEGKIQQIGTPEDIYNEPKNAFVADFIGESNIFGGIMTGKLTTRFCGGEFVCVDDVPEGTHITAVVRPEDVEITKPENGTIRGVVTAVIFKGMHYEITIQSGKNEIVARSTKAANVGDRVGICLEPDGIHIMIAEDHTNTFQVDINKDYRLEYNGQLLHASLTKLIKGGKRQEDGTIIDANGEVIDLSRIRVMASIQPEDIDMTDNQEEGLIQGNISNLIYLGSHYLYIIHTELEQDFAVYDEDLWNMGDRVGLIMPTEKMSFTIRK